MLLDAALLGVAALGAVAGWKRGFVLPLLTVAVTLFGLSSVVGYGGAGDLLPSGMAGIALGGIAAGMIGGSVMSAGSRVVGIVHRVPILIAGDHTMGAPLGVATALVGAYVLFAAVLSVDAALAPLNGNATIDAAAVAIVREAMSSQPEMRMMVDPATLDAITAEIAQGSVKSIPQEELERYDKTLAFYQKSVRPQILASALGPMLISAGERLPVVGRAVRYPEK